MRIVERERKKVVVVKERTNNLLVHHFLAKSTPQTQTQAVCFFCFDSVTRLGLALSDSLAHGLSLSVFLSLSVSLSYFPSSSTHGYAASICTR